jgi:hypothetical protein
MADFDHRTPGSMVVKTRRLTCYARVFVKVEWCSGVIAKGDFCTTQSDACQCDKSNNCCGIDKRH